MPVLDRVTVCDELVVLTICAGNVKPAGKSETLGGAIPVPLRPMPCGLPTPVYFTFSVAVRKPAAFGANLTLMVQLAVEARLVAQDPS